MSVFWLWLGIVCLTLGFAMCLALFLSVVLRYVFMDKDSE